MPIIEHPDYDSVYEPEFHSVNTLALGQLYRDGWFDLTDPSWDFPKFNNEQHERLCGKILDHYYMREIGVLPLAQWKREFLRKLNEIMPKWVERKRGLCGERYRPPVRAHPRRHHLGAFGEVEVV